MNKLVLFLYVLTMFGCSVPKAEPSSKTQMEPSLKVENLNPLPEGVGITIEIDHQDTDMYSLMVNLELANGAYVISPFSEDDTYLHFGISIPESEYYATEEAIFEYPNSTEELDPILNVPVKFVRKNTTYIRNINVETAEDFTVTGHIEFLLEPQCIPYDVDFELSHDDGKLKVTKTSIKTSESYKAPIKNSYLL